MASLLAVLAAFGIKSYLDAKSAIDQVAKDGVARLTAEANNLQQDLDRLGPRAKDLDVKIKAYQQWAANFDKFRKAHPDTPVAKIPNAIVQPPSLSLTVPAYRQGVSGNSAVSSIHARLKELGCYSGDATGNYDDATTTAVKHFQSAQFTGLKLFRIGGSAVHPDQSQQPTEYISSLEPSGIVDSVIWTYLFAPLTAIASC